MNIEEPTPKDAHAMVELVRGGFPSAQLETMIYGCHGASRFVADNILLGVNSAYRYQVARSGADVVGMAEFRVFEDMLFLNYIAVRPDYQSQGLGKQLLHQFLTQAKAKGFARFALDVFSNNLPAMGWYRNMGLIPEFERSFWVASNRPIVPSPSFIIPDFAQAESVHARLGFSEVTLCWGNHSVKIGRLGTTYFRIPTEILDGDPEWLAALFQLDPTRRLLAITPGVPPDLSLWTRIVMSTRMSLDIKEMAL